MARNPLTTSRKSDSIYQQDVARNNRERGNQANRNYKQEILSGILGLIAGFVIGFILIGGVIGVIWTALQMAWLSIPMNAGAPEPNMFANIFGMYVLSPQNYISIVFGVAGAVFVMAMTMRNKKKAAITADHTDINTYAGDRYILSVEEMIKQYKIFPDAGAHSKTVQPSSIVGHIYLSNNGIQRVELAQRDEKTGEFLLDKNGKRILKSHPMFDKKLQDFAYRSVGVKDKNQQIILDPKTIKYQKDKKGKWMSLADFIKKDWYMPDYENQRPAGAFLVEDGAVNTIVIAITRGNKGQLSVNNTIDMMSREREPQNMFINDPKGELAAGFHKLLELRGYEVIVLNLMEPSKTHQFNVLGQAIAMARLGDFDKMRDSLNTILNTFFPVEGDDPFWGQAQQTLVRMMIFSLIDYYLEEEREYLQLYGNTKDESTIAKELDEMWGKVTMFTVYQMLTSMSRDEVVFKLEEDENLSPEEEEALENEGGEEGEKMTRLSAFLKLLDALPSNKMRTIALQQSDAMDLMADSEKTRATVYGIALVAMLFFTDGPITAITSASPRQTLDVVSLAFPRRLRFKINGMFLREHKLAGKKVIFESFRDEAMTDKYEGEDFAHETKLDALGWVEYRFKGIYDNFEDLVEDDGSVTQIPKPIYVRMKIVDASTGYSTYKFEFEFTRGYAKTVDGKKFVQNPRTGERIMQGGTLRQGVVDKDTNKFIRQRDSVELVNGAIVQPIEQTDAVYNIRPKAIFSITPPHLTDYIKVVIVMVSVLFDTSVGESYITKASGKPFYKTRSILDELGNMQFNGNGIPNFQTKLSIGLGQGQEYTMILQTLQRATCCTVKSCAA